MLAPPPRLASPPPLSDSTPTCPPHPSPACRFLFLILILIRFDDTVKDCSVRVCTRNFGLSLNEWLVNLNECRNFGFDV